jgi:hypothetical protein
MSEGRAQEGPGFLKRVWRDNGLSIVIFALFAMFQLQLSVVGLVHHNDQLAEHGEPAVSYADYVTSPAFMEATMENWESEFLQMFAYVFLTVFLYQRGSAESKDPDAREVVDRDPRTRRDRADVPWPVRRGGWMLRVYEHSLSLGLLLLFLLSFALHVMSGAREASRQALLHGGEAVTSWSYLASAQLWFESLQNWQSEFFSIGMMVVLSIFLRERGSPESKPVDAPHAATGAD